MIWVTWRQHRGEAAVAALAVGVLAALLLITRQQIQALGPVSSQSQDSQGVSMSAYSPTFLSLVMLAKYALMVLPAVLGVFVGAPLLAREIDQRTHLFAWAQSITRTRWFGYQVALVSAGTLASAAILSVLATWWHSPLDGQFDAGRWVFFDAIGMVPLAYALFAFAVGVSLGTLLGRTVPAMFITAMLFTGARVGVSLLRPWFLPPVVKELAFYQTFPHGALQMNLHWVDGSNHEVSADRIRQLLGQGLHDYSLQTIQPGGTSSLIQPKPPAAESIAVAQQVDHYMRAQGFHYLAVFQPDDRFWTFQWIEAGLFFTLAAVLFAISAWWLENRGR